MANRNLDISGHNPYLIYQMLHREVSFKPLRRKKVKTGIVKCVQRNIFKKEIELKIEGKIFSFKEPIAIIQTNGSEYGSVMFIYGDLNPEMSDSELFKQMGGNGAEYYGETVDDILSRTKQNKIKTIEFVLGEKTRRHKTWIVKKQK